MAIDQRSTTQETTVAAPGADGPVRIALVGAECSGKTTLGQALARSLPAVWVDELLREFCERAGRTPTREEQPALMREQIEREQAALECARREGLAFVVCDSTPLVTALYSVQLFGDRSLLADALAHQRGYAATLLTGIDLPWEADGIQRDGPRARARFDARLRSTLRGSGLAHTAIDGAQDRRLGLALAALDPLALPYNRRTR